MIHLIDESEQRLVPVVESRRLDIAEYTGDQVGIGQQFRRNCGVGFQSKRAVVLL